MKKLILTIILIITVALFLPSKADAQTGSDCHGVFTKESNACLKESTKCIDSCVDKGYAAMSLTVDGGKVMKECTRSVCDPASKACDDKAMANFRACQDVKNSPKNSAKAEKSPLEKLLDMPVFIGDWLERISVGSAGLAFLDLSNDLGSVLLEDPEIAIWEEEQRQKYNKDFEAAFGKEWQYQMQFSQPKIEAKTEEEAWKIPVSKEQSVIDVPGTSDTKRYSWDENSGVVVKSNDWEKIKFSEPVEVEGFTKHTLELGEGAVEVKVRNNKPSENQFGVDAGWLGVTVSRTHFWINKSQDKKVAVIGVYEGGVEVKTKDGQIIKIKPDGNTSGVVVVTQKLSPLKLALAGLVAIIVLAGTAWFLKRKKKR